MAGCLSRLFCCGRKPDEEIDDLHKNEKWGMLNDENRKVRDIGCCLIFLLFWVGMIVIGAVGLAEGEPKRLLYGNDYKGRTCGVDTEVETRKYVTYPRPNEDMLINMQYSDPTEYQFYGICVSKCPDQLDVVCNDDVSGVNQTDLRSCFEGGSPSGVDCNEVEDNCWVTPTPTSSVLFRCIPQYNITQSVDTTCIWPKNINNPNDPECVIVREERDGTVERPAKPNFLFEKLNSAQQLWGRYFGDLSRTWWVIVLCAVVLGVILGLVWLTFLKWCTGVIVWVTIWLALIVMIALTVFLYYKGGVISPSDIPGIDQIPGVDTSRFVDQRLDDQNSNEKAYRIVAYIMTGICIIALGLLIALRKSIRIAIDVIKLGADALRSHPLLILYPITTVVAILGFMCWWIFVAASLMSAGDITTTDFRNQIQASINELNSSLNINVSSVNNVFASVQERSITRYLIIYHVFGMLWTNQFVIGCSITVIAGVVCGWYWSQNENKLDELKCYEQPKHSIWASTKRVIKYHLGSIAFGALLIAIIQMIRLIMAYLQRRTKRLQQQNRLVRALFCVVQCLLWCFQKCLEVVTRNAYIYIAMKGVSFCAAGRRTIKLIIDYFKTLAVVNLLSEIMMFIGKLLVATACAFVSFGVIDNISRFQQGGEDEVSSAWLPALVTFIFAYVVATAFFIVYDIAVDSILVCYITDMDENYIRNGGKSTKDRIAIHVKKARINNIKQKQREQLKEDGVIDDEKDTSTEASESYSSVQIVNPRAVAANVPGTPAE